MAKHYSSEQWADYARGTAEPRLSAEMTRHLDAGCTKCGQSAATWTRVVELARKEPGYQPPAGGVRLAKSYFPMYRTVNKPSRLPRLARLVFDSFRQPQLEGVRSGAPAPRHFIYQTGPMLIDVWMDPAKESVPAVLTGQMLDRSKPGNAVQDMPVRLRCGGAEISATKTNPFGEFHFEVPRAAKAGLQLTIGEDERKAVLVPLKFTGEQISGDE